MDAISEVVQTHWVTVVCMCVCVFPFSLCIPVALGNLGQNN